MIHTLPMRISPLFIALLLSGCANLMPQPTNNDTLNKIKDELKLAAETKPINTATPTSINDALLPPLKISIPKAAAKQLEPRFDLVISNAPASQVLMGIVSGTPYSMLVHPDVTGNISVNLKDVTVFDALDSLREVYGYEYKREGNRIFILKQGLQTKVYKVNYISGIRKGSSEISVTSGASSESAGGGGFGGVGNVGGGARSRVQQASRLNMSARTDFWGDVEDTVRTIIDCDIPGQMQSQSQGSSNSGGNNASGSGGQSTLQAEFSLNESRKRGKTGCVGGKSVVLNQLSGTIFVRATPDELRTIEQMLHAMQVNIEKQVVIEAKIIDVELNSSSQQGVNWAGFRQGTHRVSSGADTTTIGETGNGAGGTLVADSTLGGVLSTTLIGATGTAFTNGLGIALQTKNFSAMLNFLQTQGKVNVLSSPRIATLNNQKAVLKVGKDEQFVTGFDQNANINANNNLGGTTINTPTPVYSTYFSGISLDVTPQIDDDGNITLHVHPLISEITEVEKKTINNQLLPFASNKISETDSVVKVKDGQIVVIGGLMTDSYIDNRSKVPGAGELPVFGALFRKSGQTLTKRELVIMIKPTIVVDGTWSDEIENVQRNIESVEKQSNNSNGVK
ncbi:MAG: secretin N-terminal domain-containing protein [Methylotenera sp.]|nr:secretin N-terminal domain-containing protein [Methylotenera sp.]